jgi:hypothetical protein
MARKLAGPFEKRRCGDTVPGEKRRSHHSVSVTLHEAPCELGGVRALAQTGRQLQGGQGGKPLVFVWRASRANGSGWAVSTIFFAGPNSSEWAFVLHSNSGIEGALVAKRSVVCRSKGRARCSLDLRCPFVVKIMQMREWTGRIYAPHAAAVTAADGRCPITTRRGTKVRCGRYRGKL